jgi:hypothetical protein
MRTMDRRSLPEALYRWVEAGLIDADQADAIAAHEAALGAPERSPLAGRFSLGAVLAYAGTFVAVFAVLALYNTVLQDASERARLSLMFVVALISAALALVASRVRGGEALADALGAATVATALWATIEVFTAAGWLGDTPARGAPGYLHALGELRASLFGVGAVGAIVGYGAARGLRSPLSAAASAAAIAWCAGVVAWWVGNPANGAPGIAGGQAIVIVGNGLALLALWPAALRLRGSAPLWWELGGLGAANVAAVSLASAHGGILEGLLLAYAGALLAVALLRGGRLFLVAAAAALYEYVAIVVFRTFEGAVAAIVVLALVGLGTAFAGAFGQRVGFGWLWRLTAPRHRASDGPASAVPPPPGDDDWDLDADEEADADVADEPNEEGTEPWR